MDRNLQNFLLVAENGSFTRASSMHGISQPALTKSIQKLEELYQVQLFDRVARGVILTDYGEALLRSAKAARNELDHVREELERMRIGSHARLRIGCGPLWAMTIVPEIVATLEGEFSDLRAEVTLEHRGALVKMLEERAIDVAVSGAFEPLDSPTIGYRELHHASSIVVARQDHPAHNTQIGSIEDLNAFHWTNMLRNQFDVVVSASTTIRRIPAEPQVTLTTNSINVALTHAAKTDNLVIVPAALEEFSERHGLSRVSLPHPFREFGTGIYYLKSARNRPVVRSFLKHLIAWDDARHAEEGQ